MVVVYQLKESFTTIAKRLQDSKECILQDWLIQENSRKRTVQSKQRSQNSAVKTVRPKSIPCCQVLHGWVNRSELFVSCMNGTIVWYFLSTYWILFQYLISTFLAPI